MICCYLCCLFWVLGLAVCLKLVGLTVCMLVVGCLFNYAFVGLRFDLHLMVGWVLCFGCGGFELLGVLFAAFVVVCGVFGGCWLRGWFVFGVLLLRFICICWFTRWCGSELVYVVLFYVRLFVCCRVGYCCCGWAWVL